MKSSPDLMPTGKTSIFRICWSNLLNNIKRIWLWPLYLVLWKDKISFIALCFCRVGPYPRLQGQGCRYFEGHPSAHRRWGRHGPRAIHELCQKWVGKEGCVNRRVLWIYCTKQYSAKLVVVCWNNVTCQMCCWCTLKSVLLFFFLSLTGKISVYRNGAFLSFLFTLYYFDSQFAWCG